jgi:hypothetical protein
MTPLGDASACDSQPVECTTTIGGPDAGPSDDAAIAAPPDALPLPPPPLDASTCDYPAICALTEQLIPRPMTHDAFIQALVGDWALCGQTSLFLTNESGLRIAPDGNWYKLYDMGGTLYPGQGVGEQGTWYVLDPNGQNGLETFQVNFVVGDHTLLSAVGFAVNPRKIRINPGGRWADYVAAECTNAIDGPADAALTPPPEPTFTQSDGAACDYPGLCSLTAQPVANATAQDAFVKQIVGDWMLCGQTSFFGTHEAGLTITSDGNWYRLYDTGGAIVRGSGFDKQGFWTLSAPTGGPSPFQVTFISPGSGYIYANPVLSVNPRKMHINNNWVIGDYVFAQCQ